MSKSSFYVIAIAVCIIIVFFTVRMLSSEDEALVENQNQALVPLEKPEARPHLSAFNPKKQGIDKPVEAQISLATQIEDIANAYSDTAQYPVNSQPIKDPAQIVTFAPFEENATDFSLDSELYGKVRLSVATKQYQHFVGDDIEVLITLANVPDSASVSAEASLTHIDGKEIIPIELNRRFEETWKFNASVSAMELEETSLPQELQVAARVEADGEIFFSTASLQYHDPSATITGLDYPNPNAEYLDIPLSLEVHEKGYFYLSAVLYDQSGKKPLVQLQQEARLGEGEQEMVLKAHIQALKFHLDEGPYILKHLQIRRGAEEGESVDQQGNSQSQAYEIDAFSFDRYEDKPYRNELAQEREAFLRRLSSVSGGQH
uniref:DUF4785 family immunoglobulin-like domain-containing protein n=1 Tax=Ningiella ruwaisensis TaxID=2364274 RepID=UPI00109EFF64|nr:hypothetical protein [Ningiella ruwaisensis]